MSGVDQVIGIVAEPGMIRAWLAVAKTGDEFVYATRVFLPQGSPGGAAMRDLAERGLVHLKQRKVAGRTERNYVAERSSVPIEKPRRACVTKVGREAANAQAIDALYPLLARAAQFGRPCPTDIQLADRASVGRSEVAPALRDMEDQGLIRIKSVKAPTLRQVTIVETGQRTGMVA